MSLCWRMTWWHVGSSTHPSILDSCHNPKKKRGTGGRREGGAEKQSNSFIHFRGMEMLEFLVAHRWFFFVFSTSQTIPNRQNQTAPFLPTFVSFFNSLALAGSFFFSVWRPDFRSWNGFYFVSRWIFPFRPSVRLLPRRSNESFSCFPKHFLFVLTW